MTSFEWSTINRIVRQIQEKPMKNEHGSYKKRYETHTSKPEKYDPNNLLTGMIKILKLKNDAALSRALEVAPPVISKIRHGRLPVGASLLIRMQEISNMSIRELREMMGHECA